MDYISFWIKVSISKDKDFAHSLSLLHGRTKRREKLPAANFLLVLKIPLYIQYKNACRFGTN